MKYILNVELDYGLVFEGKNYKSLFIGFEGFWIVKSFKEKMELILEFLFNMVLEIMGIKEFFGNCSGFWSIYLVVFLFSGF